MDKKQKITYVEYARKSSEQEDKQAASIGSQKKELGVIAKSAVLHLHLILEESHSAKRPGRPIFDEMIQLIEDGKVNGILTWHISRLSRNAVDTGILIDLMDRGKLLEIKTPSQAFGNLPNDKFLLTLFSGQAKLENDNKGIDVQRGLRAAAERGCYPTHAPVGYMNDKTGQRGFKQMFPDPDRFALVRKMFDLMLEGNLTPPRILKIANEGWGFRSLKGNPLSRSNIYNIFTRPFYYGEFEYPVGSGNWYKGSHKPMITKQEHKRIQELLGRTSQPRPKTHTKTFAYRGSIRCGECGALITAEEKIKKQKNGNVHRYVYYHCTKRANPDCSQKAIREVELEKQIASELASLEIPPEFHSWAMKELKALNEKEATSRNKIYESNRRAYEKSLQKIDNLIEMRANGEISEFEFTPKKAAEEKIMHKAKEMLDDTDLRIKDWLETVDQYLTFAESAREEFNNGTIEKRKAICSALGSNLLLKDRKLIFDLDNLLVPIRSAAKEVKTIHAELEPQKGVVKHEQLEQMYSNSPRLLPD